MRMQVSQLPAVMRQVEDRTEQSPGYEAVAAVLEALHPPLVWPGDLTGALVRSLGRRLALLLCQESVHNKQRPLHLPQGSSSMPAAWLVSTRAIRPCAINLHLTATLHQLDAPLCFLQRVEEALAPLQQLLCLSCGNFSRLCAAAPA